MMKPPTLRLLSSTSGSITLNWSTNFKPPLSSSGSSSSLHLRQRHSRSSLSSEDRKVSRTSLGSTDTIIMRRAILPTPRESIDELPESPETAPQTNKEWFTLQKLHRLRGWVTVYWGYKTQVELTPLAPGEVFRFRIKTSSEEESSDWSDILTTATKDDVLSAASLHRALDQGHMTNARKVLALRISTLELPNRFGRTPLAMAAVRGDAAIAGMLMTCGADVTAVEMGSHRTPMMIAAFVGCNDLINVIKEKNPGYKSERDRFGQTAFHYVALSPQPAMVPWKDFLESTGSSGSLDWSPLMLAVVSGAPTETIKYFLDHGGNAKESDKRGQTLLMQAVLAGNAKNVNLLIKYGADKYAVNINRHTAYDMGKHSTNKEILKLLPKIEVQKENAFDILPKRRKQSHV